MPLSEGWDRLGATLRSYSTDPNTAALGAKSLSDMDQEQKLKKLSEKKAEQVKQGVFGKLLENALANGSKDEDTLKKLASGAGLDATGMGLATLGKQQDPLEKRQKIAQSFAGKATPESLDAFMQTGKWSDIKYVKPKADKGVVLTPGAQLRNGATGELTAENTNPRSVARAAGPAKPKPANYIDPTGKTVLIDESDPMQVKKAMDGGWTKTSSGSAAGYKDKVRSTVMAENEKLRAEIGDSLKLSDRYKLARAKINENVANGITTPTTGDKLKGELDKRRESLTRYDDAAERMISILDKDPTAATIGADTAKSALDMVANAKGLINLRPGADLTDVDLEPTHWSEQLTKIAGDNNELRTTMFSLAMQKMIAEGLQTGKFTNQQMSQALDQIGAAGRSPRAMRRKLQEVRKQVAGSLDSALNGALEDYSSLDRTDPTQTKPSPAEAAAELKRRGKL